VRVLHVVKTSEGAFWAAWQCHVLKQLGIDIHVVLPSSLGQSVAIWKNSDVKIHIADISLPLHQPWLWSSTKKKIKNLIDKIKPDIIHSHFVTNTLALRLALGEKHDIPRIFQVPGPLHLEHAFYRYTEIKTSCFLDYWIASSDYIKKLYINRRVQKKRIFLSYYGVNPNHLEMNCTGLLRKKLNIDKNCKIIGNINYMYPPKYFLGQTKGLKRHEDVIYALGIVCKRQPNIKGVLIGGQWGGGNLYEKSLQHRAKGMAYDKIILTGRIDSEIAKHLWRDFDCAIHVPISENCGGVLEPLAAGVPTIASRVGGLPEVVFDGLTGWLVAPCKPKQLAKTILEVMANPSEAYRRTTLGKKLVREMFNVSRTGTEIFKIYQHILNPQNPTPVPFDPKIFVERLL